MRPLRCDNCAVRRGLGEGRRRWMPPALAAAVAIGLALAGNLATSAVHVTGWWRPVIWIVVVILAVLTVAMAVRQARARPLPGTPAQIGDIDEAALLNKFVRRELARSYDRLRQVSTGEPLQVHW